MVVSSRGFKGGGVGRRGRHVQGCPKKTPVSENNFFLQIYSAMIGREDKITLISTFNFLAIGPLFLGNPVSWQPRFVDVLATRIGGFPLANVPRCVFSTVLLEY